MYVSIRGFLLEGAKVMTIYLHQYTIATMLTKLLYPLQNGNTPLHIAAMGGHTTCVEHLLSTPGIDVNIKNMVSWSTKYERYAML